MKMTTKYFMLVVLTLPAFILIPQRLSLSATQNAEELPRLDEDAKDPPTAPTTTPKPTPEMGKEFVYIIVCDAKPDQILLLNNSGVWLQTVRSVDIKFSIDIPPTVTCTMWAGPYRPTNPEVKVWGLSQIKSVNITEFQDMVDSLQTDPEAIRRRVAE